METELCDLVYELAHVFGIIQESRRVSKKTGSTHSS